MSKAKTTRRVVIAAILMIGVASIVLVPSAMAIEPSIQAGLNSARGTGQPAELFGASGIFTTISNLLLFIIGALSVLMIIFGGLRYVISGGNTASVTAAKNTVLYAIVGVIVAFLAYAAINFVLGSLMPGSTGGTNV